MNLPNEKQQAEHLYRELLKSSTGSVKDSMERQENIVRPWIENSISSLGVENTSRYLLSVASFSSAWDSEVRPLFSEVVDVLNTLHAQGITSDSRLFSRHISDVAADGTLHAFTVGKDKDGNDTFTARENPDYRAPVVTENAELHAALQAQQEVMAEAERMQDAHTYRSAQKSIGLIQNQLGASAPAADTPPEVPGVSNAEFVAGFREVFGSQTDEVETEVPD